MLWKGQPGFALPPLAVTMTLSGLVRLLLPGGLVGVGSACDLNHRIAGAGGWGCRVPLVVVTVPQAVLSVFGGDSGTVDRAFHGQAGAMVVSGLALPGAVAATAGNNSPTRDRNQKRNKQVI